MPSGGRRLGRIERWAPLSYFVAALVLALVALPSVLRPEPPPSTQTAELSPDAPPDDEQDQIISALSRASSGTAGDATGEGSGTVEVLIERMKTVAPVRRACPRGFGNPPRQTFSYYSAPCALVWSGDNGGDTWRGVTRDEVRVAVGYPFNDMGTPGRVPAAPVEGQSGVDRTWTVLQAWLNANHQFYGRRMQLYVINHSNDAAGASSAGAAAESYGVFAAAMGDYRPLREFASRGIIDFAEFNNDQYADNFLEEFSPYLWQTLPSTTRMAQLGAEYICKKLWGRNAVYAESQASRKRELGVIYNDFEGVTPFDRELDEHLARQCGARVKVAIGLPSSGATSGDTSAMQTAVARFAAEGVTTVINTLNWSDSTPFTTLASSALYYPEWLVLGRGLLDSSFHAALQDPSQWRAAFGISGREIDYDDDAECDGVKAYRELDPSGSPDTTAACNIFTALLQIANGIQTAGPRLTPGTFQAGLFGLGQRRAEPRFTMGGGYGPGDHSYVDEVGEIWWDPTASNSGGANPGGYRWTFGGAKWRAGEIPADDAQLFREGVYRRSDAA